jgi:hypothetical protein
MKRMAESYSSDAASAKVTDQLLMPAAEPGGYLLNNPKMFVATSASSRCIGRQKAIRARGLNRYAT